MKTSRFILSLMVVVFAVAGAFASVNFDKLDVTSYYRPDPNSTSNCTSFGTQDCQTTDSGTTCTLFIPAVDANRVMYQSNCTSTLFVDPD